MVESVEASQIIQEVLPRYLKSAVWQFSSRAGGLLIQEIWQVCRATDSPAVTNKFAVGLLRVAVHIHMTLRMNTWTVILG